VLLYYYIDRFVLGSLCVGDLVRLGLSSVRVAGWNLLQPATRNKTTDMIIQQHSRKLLMMDILMSETCWVHKKWNKIASDIKLVFYSLISQCLSIHVSAAHALRKGIYWNILRETFLRSETFHYIIIDCHKTLPFKAWRLFHVSPGLKIKKFYIVLTLRLCVLFDFFLVQY